MDLTRNSKIDFYKGLLIFGVTWGHMISALKYTSDEISWILTFFRTYDMPFFAFLSGFFIFSSRKNHTLFENIRKKINRILIPALTWGIIHNLISGKIAVYSGGLWYLWATFFSSIIIIIISYFISNKFFQGIIFLFVVLLTHIGVGDKVNLGFLLFPMIFGYYYNYSSNYFLKKQMDLSIYIIFLLFTFLQCFWTPMYNVWNSGCNILAENYIHLLPIIFRGSLGIVGSLSMMMIFDRLYYCMEKSENYITHRLLQKIIALGKLSMEIYILQTLFVSRFIAKFVEIQTKKIGRNYITINMPLLNMFIAPLLSIAVIIIMIFVQSLLKKTPIVKEFIFGLSLNNSKCLIEQKTNN